MVQVYWGQRLLRIALVVVCRPHWPQGSTLHRGLLATSVTVRSVLLVGYKALANHADSLTPHNAVVLVVVHQASACEWHHRLEGRAFAYHHTRTVSLLHAVTVSLSVAPSSQAAAMGSTLRCAVTSSCSAATGALGWQALRRSACGWPPHKVCLFVHSPVHSPGHFNRSTQSACACTLSSVCTAV
jgi:hypothetical protein